MDQNTPQSVEVQRIALLRFAKRKVQKHRWSCCREMIFPGRHRLKKKGPAARQLAVNDRAKGINS